MDPHQEKLIEAADSLGITVTDLNDKWNRDAVLYSYQNKEELVLDGRIYSSLTHHADLICDDKNVTKTIFRDLGIPTPDSMVFTVTEDEDDAPKNEVEDQIREFFRKGIKYVCKPVYGTDGHAVAMHLDDDWGIADHAGQYRETYKTWLLEEQVEGEDLRIQVIGGELIAACVRKPAFVEGDGTHTLDELMEMHNEKIAKQNPANRMVLDAASRQLMRDQNVFLSTVIDEGRKIVLKHVSNMGQGGRAQDVTDVLHPDYGEWIKKISKEFGISTFGFDAITEDVSAAPDAHSFAIEINAKSQWLHHTFSELKQHDIPTLILKDLFGITT